MPCLKKRVMLEFDLKNVQLVVGPSVKVVALFESRSCSDNFERNVQFLKQIEEDRSIITIVTGGVSDLFTRLVMNKISTENPNIIFFGITDGQLDGYLMTDQFQHGVNFWYFPLNDHLVVKRLIRLCLNPCNLFDPYVVHSPINAAKKQEFIERLNRILNQNTFGIPNECFDYHKEYIENLTLSLLIERNAQSQELSCTKTLALMLHIQATFSPQQLALSYTDGVPYFEVRNQLENVWLEFYDSPNILNLIDRIDEYGIPSIYMNLFVNIINSMPHGQFNMFNPIFNSRLDGAYT